MKEIPVHLLFVTSHVHVIGFLNSFSVFCCRYKPIIHQKSSSTMRKIIIVLLAAVFSISSYAGIIYVPANASDNSKAGVETNIEKVKATNMDAFLALTPAKVQEMTGKKMTFGQRIALKMAQKKLSKQLKKGKSIDIHDESQMLRLWVIFALVALVLTILGIFITFLWFLSGLAWLAAVIFFILWLLAIAA
jgi:hypothetical protein